RVKVDLRAVDLRPVAGAQVGDLVGAPDALDLGVGAGGLLVLEDDDVLARTADADQVLREVERLRVALFAEHEDEHRFLQVRSSYNTFPGRPRSRKLTRADACRELFGRAHP